VVPIRCLAEVPDWESAMSNHTVAVSDLCKFCIMQGVFARRKEDAMWDCPMTSQISDGVIGTNTLK
jgi:hypothetical protein